MTAQQHIKAITFLGAVPFLFALILATEHRWSWLQTFGFEPQYVRFKAMALAHSYGALIATFLAGIHWGLSLRSETQRYISSSVLMLLAWVSLFRLSSNFGLLLLMGCFVMAWWLDGQGYRQQVIPKWYWQLRSRISLLVLACIGAILWLVN